MTKKIQDIDFQVGDNAGEHLNNFVERIERLTEERDAFTTDIKAVYEEAKGTGFDTKIMRQVVRLRAMDQDQLEKHRALIDTYMDALKKRSKKS